MIRRHILCEGLLRDVVTNLVLVSHIACVATCWQGHPVATSHRHLHAYTAVERAHLRWRVERLVDHGKSRVAGRLPDCLHAIGCLMHHAYTLLLRGVEAVVGAVVFHFEFMRP